MRNPAEYPDDLCPWNLEPHYSRHTSAITAEGLHSKAEIATQLAWRDQTIERLRAEIGLLRFPVTAAEPSNAELIAQVRDCIDFEPDYMSAALNAFNEIERRLVIP